MARFRKDPDPRFWRVNRSIEFDWRLGPYDIDQSRAHAQALCKVGVLTEDELRQLDEGLQQVGEEMESGGFEFEPEDEDEADDEGPGLLDDDPLAIGPEGEPETIRLWASREQMLALSRHGAEVADRGRPTCRFCGNPIDPEGHVCPATNGHRAARA